MEKQFGLPQL